MAKSKKEEPSEKKEEKTESTESTESKTTKQVSANTDTLKTQAATLTDVAPKPSESINPAEEFRRRKRIVRIEPSPFKKVPLKLKMSQAKVNSAGYALKTPEGDIQKVDVDVENAVQVPGTAKTVAPALTPSGLNTGLNILVDNPFIDEPVYHPSWGEKVLKGKKKALLQHVLEYKHGKDFDYYTGNLWDRINPSSDVATLPFFLTPHSKMLLDGNVTFLHLSNPLDEVKYYMLRAHKLVANSYSELDEGRNPDAWYYMLDEDEVQDVKVEKLRKETRAASILEDLNTKGEPLIRMAKALGNDDKKLTIKKAFRFVHDYYSKSETAYNEFMKYHELYRDSARRAQFYAAADLQDYLNYGIVRYRDGKYYWVKPETDDSPMEHYEWVTKEKFIKDFLLAPEYQEEVALLKSVYESRKY